MPRKRLQFIEKHRDDPSDIPQPDLHVVNNSENTAAMPVENWRSITNILFRLSAKDKLRRST